MTVPGVSEEAKKVLCGCGNTEKYPEHERYGKHCMAEMDDDYMRDIVRRIIDSYTLCMVGTDAEPYISACADDILYEVIGWPVTYPSQRGMGPMSR